MKRLFLFLLFLPACACGRRNEDALQSYYAAESAFNQQDYESAVPLYEGTLAERDAIPEAHLHLAISYEETGDMNAAIRTLERFLQFVHPAHLEANLQLARLYADRGEKEKAVKMLTALLDKKPPHPEKLQAEVARISRSMPVKPVLPEAPPRTVPPDPKPEEVKPLPPVKEPEREEPPIQKEPTSEPAPTPAPPDPGTEEKIPSAVVEAPPTTDPETETPAPSPATPAPTEDPVLLQKNGDDALLAATGPYLEILKSMGQLPTDKGELQTLLTKIRDTESLFRSARTSFTEAQKRMANPADLDKRIDLIDRRLKNLGDYSEKVKAGL